MSITKGGVAMPGRDGTGPLGRGALSGRGMGYCAGVDSGYGRRPGPGMGIGRGLRRRYWALEPADSRSLKEILEEEKSLLESRLRVLDKRLGSLSDPEE